MIKRHPASFLTTICLLSMTVSCCAPTAHAVDFRKAFRKAIGRKKKDAYKSKLKSDAKIVGKIAKQLGKGKSRDSLWKEKYIEPVSSLANVDTNSAAFLRRFPKNTKSGQRVRGAILQAKNIHDKVFVVSATSYRFSVRDSASVQSDSGLSGVSLPESTSSFRAVSIGAGTRGVARQRDTVYGMFPD